MAGGCGTEERLKNGAFHEVTLLQRWAAVGRGKAITWLDSKDRVREGV